MSLYLFSLTVFPL